MLKLLLIQGLLMQQIVTALIFLNGGTNLILFLGRQEVHL